MTLSMGGEFSLLPPVPPVAARPRALPLRLEYPGPCDALRLRDGAASGTGTAFDRDVSALGEAGAELEAALNCFFNL